MAAGDSAEIWVWLSSGGTQLTMDLFRVGGVHNTYTDTVLNLSAYAGMADSMMFALASCNPFVDEIRTDGNVVFFDNVRFNGSNNAQIPDSSFENWTSRVQYFTKEMYNMQALTTKTTDAYNGMFALNMSTTNVQWDESRSQLGMNNILALWGKEDWIEISPDNYKLNISGGLPIEERKDTLVVYYKYMPPEGVTDTAMINLKFQKADTEAITYYNELMASETYKKFEIPFDLDNNWTMTSIDADSMILELGSSKYRNGFTQADTIIEGSSLTIDYMYFKSQIYSLTASSGQHGSVTPSDTSLIRGSSIIYSILPDVGYLPDTVTFNDADITEELVQTENGYTFTIDSVTGSGSLKVNFKNELYLQTVTFGSSGSITPTDTSLILGDNITFTILPDSGYELNSATYNDVDIMGELLQVGDGYTFTIDSIEGPGVIFADFSKLPTGIENTLSDATISFYPNPTRGLIHLNGISTDCNVEILSVTGAVVFQKTISENDVIDISDFPEGIYLIRVNESIYDKIMKQ